MQILSFQNALDLAMEFERLGTLAQIEERVFPDGELLVRLPPSERDVVVVARLYPGVNENLFKLFLALDALNDQGAGRIVLVLPYLPYARQDRRFRQGEPISSKTVLRILSLFNVSAIVAVDVHKQYVADYAPCVLFRNVYPAEEYARVFRDVDVVVSPDFGSIHRAEAVAKALGVSFTYFEKYRDRETGGITLIPRDADLRNAHVLLVDDILSTGGTLVEACKAAKNLGATAVYAAVTHCQLLRDSREKIKTCLDRLVCTDTILNEFAEVKVGPVLRKEVERLL